MITPTSSAEHPASNTDLGSRNGTGSARASGEVKLSVACICTSTSTHSDLSRALNDLQNTLCFGLVHLGLILDGLSSGRSVLCRLSTVSILTTPGKALDAGSQ